jgi:sterol desaturase/sphingolipid hydroxylase (fatty acid hydroxylase superfamily)
MAGGLFDLAEVVPWVKALSSLGLLLLVLLELWKNPEFREDSFRDSSRRGRNWTYLAASLGTMLCFGPTIRWFDLELPKLLDWSTVPFSLELIGVFFLAELFNWGVHFLKHRSDFFWRLHFQHHADSHFGLWLSAHTHAFEVLVSGTLMAAAIVSLGFSLEAAEIYLAFYSVTTVYQHSSALRTLGPLDWLIVSPDYHRIHHEVGAQTNYAGRLTLFDVIFRTATWPRKDRKAGPLGIGEASLEPWGFSREFTWFLEPQAQRNSDKVLKSSRGARGPYRFSESAFSLSRR